MIRTIENMVAALTAPKISAVVAERIAIVFSLEDNQRIVAEDNKSKLLGLEKNRWRWVSCA